ncbi:hypothetical protein N027_04040 [Pseudomonas syringae USA007]|uniref:Uncharacterized protein n=1 Tax=Pseudomonas syringae USA007 TaxID=1357288 RepID=A0AAU8MAY9_PSESX|nr:hypothetical protein [Pseudomonas syringae]
MIFRNKPKGFLESRHTVFVADIQKMPTIAKVLAIPQMRDYSYRVMLDRDARIVPQYAGDDDKVLWLQLRDGHLISQPPKAFLYGAEGIKSQSNGTQNMHSGIGY